MDILESSCDIPSVTPPSDAFVIDGAAMVNSRPPRGAQTFLAYVNDVILSYIESCINKYSRVDIVFDVYIRNSLKADQGRRGVQVFDGKSFKQVRSKRPKVWSSFLLDDDNKYELFTYLAGKFLISKLIKQGEDIVVNANIDTSHLCPCNHGEVNTRMLLRVQHAVANDCKE